MSKELTVQNGDCQLAESSSPIDILRFAIERGADVQTIERLMVVRRELNAEAAKKAYDAAMANFQSQCPIIIKKKAGAKDAYRYAPLDDIVSQVKELIRENGFSFSINSRVEDKFVVAICKVTHEAGHFEVSEFQCPVDNKNPMMTDPQRFGGAMTFSKRYAFCNAFGILTADQDTDGAAPTERPEGRSGPQVKRETQPQAPSADELRDKLYTMLRGKCENKISAINAYLIEKGAISDMENVKTLTPERIAQAIEKLKEELF
jgi:hypothetical protein